MVQKQVKQQQKQNLKVSFIVFSVILIIIMGIFFSLKKIMPEYMFNQGKKYMAAGNYDKAYKMFKMSSEARPYDDNAIYYQVMALSKLPPSYENQKKLYEIAQLDDCDEASRLADNILMNMRKQLDRQVGPNYIDNVLYEDQLVRWNIKTPITYSISGDSSIPKEYYETVRKALLNWQTATNGEIMFKETMGNKNANICFSFVDDLTFKDKYEPERIGKAVPAIKDNTLQRIDVYIKPTDTKGIRINNDKLLPLAEHEIGHALGLWGHSASPDDIMYHTGDYLNNDTKTTGISSRDVNTLMLIYKMIPDVIDIPLAPEDYNNMFYHQILTTYPGENFELEIQRLISQLKDDRQNIIVWVDLAINYAYKKQYERSNYILNRVLPLVVNDYQNQHVILYNLAANYYKMRNYVTAERYLNLATKINDDLDTQILESFIDLRLGRKQIAKDKLKELHKQYPDHIEIALKLAEIYNSEKDKNLEKFVIDTLVKHNPKAIKDRRVQKYKSKGKFIASNKR